MEEHVWVGVGLTGKHAQNPHQAGSVTRFHRVQGVVRGQNASNAALVDVRLRDKLPLVIQSGEFLLLGRTESFVKVCVKEVYASRTIV